MFKISVCVVIGCGDGISVCRIAISSVFTCYERLVVLFSSESIHVHVNKGFIFHFCDCYMRVRFDGYMLTPSDVVFCLYISSFLSKSVCL